MCAATPSLIDSECCKPHLPWPQVNPCPPNPAFPKGIAFFVQQLNSLAELSAKEVVKNKTDEHTKGFHLRGKAKCHQCVSVNCSWWYVLLGSPCKWTDFITRNLFRRIWNLVLQTLLDVHVLRNAALNNATQPEGGFWVPSCKPCAHISSGRLGCLLKSQLWTRLRSTALLLHLNSIGSVGL